MTARNASLAGIATMLFGILLFSLNDVMGKWLVSTYAPGQLMLVRSAAALLVLSPFIFRRGLRRTLRPERPRLQCLRVLIGATESTLFYVCVTYLPLADTMTLWMAAPVWAVLLAALLLGEKVDPARWAAAGLGFLGVALAMAPSGASFSAPALLGLTGSVLFAALLIAGRHLRGTPDVTLVAWQTFGSLMLGIALLPFGWVMPTLRDFGLLALLGVVALLGHLCVTRSLKLAEASVVAPYQYTFIIWALLFGWLFFNDWPTPTMLCGAALIVLAGLTLILLERRSTRALDIARKQAASGTTLTRLRDPRPRSDGERTAA
ncbi:DMT family transporter [Bosea thiooxidans]|nr:DMT family transporter [Bosea sp. (in: a-proteobacteria)]